MASNFNFLFLKADNREKDDEKTATDAKLSSEMSSSDDDSLSLFLFFVLRLRMAILWFFLLFSTSPNQIDQTLSFPTFIDSFDELLEHSFGE